MKSGIPLEFKFETTLSDETKVHGIKWSELKHKRQQVIFRKSFMALLTEAEKAVYFKLVRA